MRFNTMIKIDIVYLKIIYLNIIQNEISCVILDIKFLSLRTAIEITYNYRIISRLHFYTFQRKLKIYKNQMV